MTKRRPKKQRKTQRPPRRPSVDVDQVLDQGQDLINEGRVEEAVALLAPLVESHPGEPDLRFMLGYALCGVGEIWGGLDECERAQRERRHPGDWWLLGMLHLQVELHAHALHALRRALERLDEAPPQVHERLRAVLADLESHVTGLSAELGIPVRQVEQGLRAMEEGIRTLNQGRFAASASASRRAIQDLGDWPPPHNNLSLALFYDGRPQEAIAASQRVLDADPNNVQALSNSIRFLVLCDREQEARRLWARLVHLEPEGTTERIKLAEAAAFLEEDESVHRLLSPLEDKEVLETLSPPLLANVRYYLAVAKANTGRRGAQRRFQEVRAYYPQASTFLAALAEKRPGPGWAARYPYFSSGELVSASVLEEWIELLSRRERMSEQRFYGQVARFVERYPQMVRMGEKLIWEEAQAEVGIELLTLLDTDAARAALRRFGLSQAGEDEARMDALYHLLEVGEIEPGTQVRVWRNGEWTELLLQRYDISAEHVSAYPSEIVKLLDAGVEALQEQAFERAEHVFRQAIAMEPRAREAYHNLSIAYSQQGKREQAIEVLRRAIEVDPSYVMARCSLALYLLHEDDLQGAQEMLAPLAHVTRFNPPEMAFYAYTRANVQMAQDEFDAARESLEMVLEILPDYQPARELLEQIDTLDPFQLYGRHMSAFWKRQLERRQARRRRLQSKLTTLVPDLAEALSLYSKDALTGMARLVMSRGGWSTLRKGDLIAELCTVLTDQVCLAQVLEGLEDPAQAALCEVISSGGSMSWQAFDARYGNDLDESAHWNYHVPESVMGCLRVRGLLVEAQVDGELWVVVPVEVRKALTEL